ncbi:RNA-polymerase associated protein [Nile crocodilepox virus]|uniref:RNA polymerase-associated transcription-specificity factor RAP94 n=1 Tax=Nile crocodilepox virus (isolate Crocodylus niloticus/Zimbabwe/Ume/2001) TaxID=1289473 RepID=Q070E7_CPRVZ|nr:RNA-polymerase associated protein [Nile crocodilepox virus]ABJ08995.1 RNA-polymerase associated protein [Nile crocodilepox virus]
MENNKEIMLLDVIKKIKRYLADDSVKEKSYADFIAENKNIFIYNLYNVNVVTEDDIKLLYITIQQNPDIDDPSLVSIFSYIGYKFKRTINERQPDDAPVATANDEFRHNFFSFFFTYLEFYAKLKTMRVLVNRENEPGDANVNYRTSELVSSFPEQPTRVVEVPFNMREIISYVSKNIDQLQFSKKYLDFCYLCRIIGVRISKKKFNLTYVIEYSVDNVVIPICVTDYLDVKYVELKETGARYRNTFQMENNPNLAVWGQLVIPRLANGTLYSSFFLSSVDLAQFFTRLVVRPDAEFVERAAAPLREIVVREPAFWRETQEIAFRVCEHQVKMDDIFRNVSVNYFEQVNAFINDMIYYEDGLAYCSYCHVHVPVFDQGVGNVAKDKVVAVNYNKKNIFNAEPYSYFVQSQRFIFNIIMSFDAVMKAQTWSMKYNINRMLIDFLIHINDKRHFYEKQFAKEIKNGIFFLRLSANLFDIRMSSTELFYTAKILNLNYIIALTITLNSSANFFLGYLKSKQIFPETDTLEAQFNYYIAVIVNQFLVKTKVLDKSAVNHILFFTDVYASIMPDEMVAYYHRLRAEVARLLVVERAKNEKDYEVENTTEVAPLRIRFFDARGSAMPVAFAHVEERSVATPSVLPSPDRPQDLEAAERDFASMSIDNVLIKLNNTAIETIEIFSTYVKVILEKKQTIISIQRLFLYRLLTYFSGPEFYVFKFGDPFPFNQTLVNVHHLNRKIDCYNFLVRSLLPDSDIFFYHSRDLNRHRLEFGFYLFLSKFVKVKKWIEQNKEKIKLLYLVNFNN